MNPTNTLIPGLALAPPNPNRPGIEDIESDLTGLLTECVVQATGNPAARPRPGQLKLSLHIGAGMASGRGHNLGQAPTGVGKSLAYLSACALMACNYGERSVISTESLSLQSQIIDKDAPTVADACAQVLGKRPQVAVLKGWSNYVCGYLATSTAHEVLDQIEHLVDAPGQPVLPDPAAPTLAPAQAQPAAKATPPHSITAVDATGTAMDRLIARLSRLNAVITAPRPAKPGFRTRAVSAPQPAAKAKGSKPSSLPQDATVEISGRTQLAAEIVPLLLWGLSAIRDEASGDRNTYPATVAEDLWSTVSVSPAECVGVDTCPFGEVCRAAIAKDRAAEADIVVTNHSMIAMQATTTAPVVIGSRKLGTFRHIVVDEAHQLPSVVRNQGASQISGQRVHSAIKALDSVLGSFDPKIERLFAEGRAVADALDMELSSRVALIPARESVLKLTEGTDPISSTGDMVSGWLMTASTLLNRVPESNHTVMVAKLRAKARLASLAEDLDKIREHRSGVARWVEAGHKSDNKFIASRTAGSGAVAKLSPVSVGGLMMANLWTGKVLIDDATAEPAVPAPDWLVPLTGAGDAGTTSEDDARYPLSVSCVSATLSNSSGRDLGLRAKKTNYESPFSSSYANSVLFVPRATEDDDIRQLASTWGQRQKFDVTRHPQWALRHMERLIEANGGKALVVSPKSENGKFYAEQLAAHARGRWTVSSQWGGLSLRQTVSQWKADTHAVLVGSKSLMTGTDAPGETCSLVILDRVPRAPANPVDDARVEEIMVSLGLDKWAADALVYAVDAAMLVEQVAGRLIRAESDTGMVAILDPRLLKVGPFSYSHKPRTIYLDALSQFTRKMSDIEQAHAWLQDRALRMAA